MNDSAEQAGPRRVAEIRSRLEQALAPDRLEVIDESHLHVGHAGARDGRGHFRVQIVSDQFAALPRLARHRLVYRALGDLMQTDIHALSIESFSKNEI
ncbi:MAG: BolA family protein [Wenzhouxiangellaceae bacterium]|nr:BolA family protein [Wenzhouxiangellaceae bacterium]